MAEKRTTQIPEEKLQRVSELVDTIKDKKTIILSSIKNIPASQYQEIVKKLRGKAIVKFPKKSMLFRAFDSSGEEAVQKLREHVKDNTAVLFSDIDSFELAAELLSKKTPAKAKAGQEAPKDITVDAGPTELIPGPAISELGAVGIPIQIEKGKIHIKESTTIVKEGEKISTAAADVMNKLGIKPFSVGFTPFAAFDKESGKLYLDIKINPEETIEGLKYAFSRALPFAVEIGYPSTETISFMIGKASIHEKSLSALVGVEKSEEAPAEESKGEESKPEESTEEGSKSEETPEVKEEETESKEQNSQEDDQNKSKEEK